MIKKRKEYLPFHRPLLGREEEEEVLRTLRSGWLSCGPKTEKFEQAIKNYVGAKFAVGLNSCTAALHLGLVVSGIKKGDEVITTPFTYVATGNVIVQQEATPVFADIESDTLNINPGLIEKKITSKTKAIMPVHYAGHPCQMDKILSIARKYKLLVIEDAAHALGSEYKGRKIGTIGDITCFSFHATKNITTGEGGMLTTEDKKKAEMVKILSLHGLSQNAWKRYLEKKFRPYEAVALGFKYNMSDLEASLGLVQLKKIEKFWRIRKSYVKRYNEAFSQVGELKLLTQQRDVKHSHYIYVVLLELEKLNINRDEFVATLREENIGASVHFMSLHLQKYYRERFGFKKLDFPEAYRASERCVSLPIYPKMSGKDIDDVIYAVKDILFKHKKRKLL